MTDIEDSPVWKRGYEACRADMLQQRETELAHHRLMTPWITLMQSLDRCEHGRHAIDDCFGTNDRGCTPLNRFLMIGQRIGTDYSGSVAIIVPSPDLMHDAEAWKAPANKACVPCKCGVVIANRYATLHRDHYCPNTVNPVPIRWSREGPREY